MNDNNLRLDGNAAGGLLNESFQFEMTKAETTCGGCATKRAIGELTLYGHELGTVLRCVDRDTALLRITHIAACHRLDLSGMTYLQIAADIHSQSSPQRRRFK